MQTPLRSVGGLWVLTLCPHSVSVVDMLERLIQIQTKNGWTDAQMAARLGMSRPHWNLMRNGRVRFTATASVRAAGAFPELTRDLLDLAAVSVPTTTHTAGEAA